MEENTTTIIVIPMDQQLQTLSQLAEQVRASLLATHIPLPQTLTENLTQLTGQLTRLSRKAATYEDERNNLKALAEISQLVNSSLEINEVLRIVMDTIVRLTGAERGFLMLKDEQGEMQISVARNWEQESIHTSDFAISHTVIDRVVNEGKSILTTNAQEDPRFGGQESIIAYSLRSILCVPLKVREQITGVIYADNRIRTGLFTETEKELLNSFANQAAIAIENARLFESVRRTLAAVSELKSLMDNVFASIASGVITADPDDKITLSNRAAERILGRTTGEIQGLKVYDLLPPLASELESHIQHARNQDEQIIGREVVLHMPNRGRLDLSFNISPLKDAQEITQGVAIVVDDLTEKKRLEAQRSLFERMVSPAVINQLDPNALRLGGNRMEITSLFADIRGFTTFSERLDPEQLISVLNQYLSAAADAVLDEQGTIDKFMGDAIMAWFNAPIPQADHPLRAVRAALGIRDAILGLHSHFPPDLQLSFGVGIHFGEAVLGLVGTETRLDYTAIGDSVNTAKRIQENARANQILISAQVYNLVQGRVKVQAVASIQAKGKSEPITVYEVLGISGE